MKKIAFLIIISSILNYLNAQIVNIPDINFKSYLVGNPDINTNSDNEIQVSEAVAFTRTIDCSDSNIFDLTGIEMFVNITKLWCYKNDLTTLHLSQNVNLEDLRCDYNQLKNLDTSHNVKLKTLLCAANKIAVLDLSKNLELRYLACYENNLVNLDLHLNKNLERLDCGLNQLINLDIGGNLALKELSCGWNQLKQLNLKNGKNSILQVMLARGNSNLSCIQVDNVEESNSKINWAKDVTASYSTDCNFMDVKDYYKKEIVLYPNPVKDILNLSEEVSDIMIKDMSGKRILEFTTSKTINLKSLPEGNYLIEFKNKLERTIIKKLIKH